LTIALLLPGPVLEPLDGSASEVGNRQNYDSQDDQYHVFPPHPARADNLAIILRKKKKAQGRSPTLYTLM